ncbi:MAG: ABC transporter substrate-binding protein [Candidatus Bipolaricaulaceae bacterium]
MKRLVLVFGVGLLAVCLAGAGAERPLRVTFAWPTYIDPAVGSDFSSSSSFVNLYDSLVYPDTDGSPIPHVATDWETSDDALVWTFYLRDDVRFHNGDLLTANDVKFSMDRLTTIGEGYGFLFVGRVERTEVVDSHTVRFYLTEPFGPFLSTLYRLYILNEDQVMANIKEPGPYGELGDYGKGWLLTHDAGSGPYMVEEFRVEEELVMVKNPDYWLPIDPEAPDEVRFIGTTEPATIRTMIARRELEISDQWQPQEALQALDDIRGVDIAAFSPGTMFYLMVNTKKPPTDDIHFRRAMAWATDYRTVVEHIFPGAFQARGPIPQNIPGADPTVFQFHRDLDKAREELQKSKYYDQLDQYEVEFHWIAEVPDEEKVALLFMANMAEIGINVKVVKVPWMTVVEEMAELETSPHIVSVFDSSHYPEAGSLLESRYHSSSAPTWEQNEWLLDDVLDAMIEEALATVDKDARFAKYAEVQQYIFDLCPTIFLFEQVEKHAFQTAYLEWPVAEGKVNPVMGYNMAARFMKVFPDKRADILGG